MISKINELFFFFKWSKTNKVSKSNQGNKGYSSHHIVCIRAHAAQPIYFVYAY